MKFSIPPNVTILECDNLETISLLTKEAKNTEKTNLEEGIITVYSIKI